MKDAAAATGDATTEPVPSPRRSWSFVAAGGVLLLLALYFAYATLWSAVRQAQAAGFVPVQAVIVESRLVERSAGSGAPRRTYHPGVRYTYSAGGVVRESTQLYFLGPTWASRGAVQAVVDRYVAGSQVMAYIDPHDPAVAVLDNTPRLPSLPMALMALVQLAFATWVLHRGWRRKA